MDDNLLGRQNATVYFLRRAASTTNQGKDTKVMAQELGCQGIVTVLLLPVTGLSSCVLTFPRHVQRQVLPDDRTGGISPSYLGMFVKYQKKAL